MPDFLDFLIRRTQDPAPPLRPRTPGLFEPVGAGYGPGGRLLPAASRAASDLGEWAAGSEGDAPSPNGPPPQDPSIHPQLPRREPSEGADRLRPTGPLADFHSPTTRGATADPVMPANTSLRAPNPRARASNDGSPAAANSSGETASPARRLAERIRALEQLATDSRAAQAKPAAPEHPVLAETSRAQAGGNSLFSQPSASSPTGTSHELAGQGPPAGPSAQLTAQPAPLQPNWLDRLSLDLAVLRRLEAELAHSREPTLAATRQLDRPTPQLGPAGSPPRPA